MGRGRIIAPVEGKPDWYLVRDDLGVQYQVQSGIEGYSYVTGKEYRLFTPDGQYDPRLFRLLPYETGKRWRSARDTAGTHPATAAAMFIHNDKLLSHQPRDKTRTIQAIDGSGAVFSEGGRAALPPGAETLYQAGDTVAVIHDTRPAPGEQCLKKGHAGPWIAGTGGKGPPKAADPGCGPLEENWIGYNGAADLLNGGASLPPSPATPGKFMYRKTLSAPNTIREWTLAVATCYAPDAALYGALCTAAANGALALDAGTAEFLPGAAAYAALTRRYPRPILMPPQYTGRTAVIAPPVVAAASVNRKLKCGARELRMAVSLATEDTYNHYTDVDGTGSGLMLPGCMILIFDKAPYPAYLGAGAINAGLIQDGGGNNIYQSVYETNLDQPFKLVYASPGAADFSTLRTGMADFTRVGHFALNRPVPRRTPGNGTTPVTATLFRNKYNAPMDDPETGFGAYGQLLTRVFNGAGNDVTPAPPPGDYCGGYFPGFFELSGAMPAAVNLCRDFLAAYPFMANPAINPTGALPRLARIVFYAQGKIWFDASGGIGGNPARVRCGGISLYHQ